MSRLIRPSPWLALLVVMLLQAGATAAEPTLVVTPSEVDLGAVGHLERRTVTFELWNPSAAPAPLGSVKASCDCMKVKISLEPLAPNERRQGQVEVSLGRGFGRFDKHVDFLGTSGSPPSVLHVRADFHPGVAVDVREFVLTGVFGQTIPEGTQMATIERKAKDPLVVEDLVVVDAVQRMHPHLMIELQTVGTQTAQVFLRVLGTHPAGIVRADVKARVNGLLVVIPVRGTVFQGIRVEPEFLNFSRIEDPARAEQRSTLRSVDGRAVVIESLRVEDNAQAAAKALDVRAESNPDGSVALIARLREPYPSPGDRLSGTVIVTTNHPDSPVIRLRFMGFVSQPR